jgi:hypothetical protein
VDLAALPTSVDGRRILGPSRRENDRMIRTGAAVRCAIATVAGAVILIGLAARAPVAGTPTRPAPTFPVVHHPVMPEDLGR